MTKLFLLSAVSLAFASLGHASIIFVSPCNAFEAPNTGPVASSTCSATADSGFFINSVTVTITSDYSGFVSSSAPNSPIVTSTYTFNADSAGFGAAFGAIPNGVVTTTIVGASGNSNPIQNYNQTVSGNFGSIVTESFLMSNTVAGGVVTVTSGVMTLTATETAIIGGVPEPATLGLVGVALLGLGFLSRRKRRV